MKFIQIYSLSLLALFAFSSNGQQLQFKVCDDSRDIQCQQNALAQAKSQMQESLLEDLGIQIKDSVFVRFIVTEEAKVEVIKSESFFSMYTASLMRGIVEAYLPENLSSSTQSGTYEIGFDFSISEDFKDGFVELHDAKRFPVVKNCVEFNKYGQKACLRYLGNILTDEVNESYRLQGEGIYHLYIENNRLKAVSCELPFLEKRVFDYFALNADRVFREYINSNQSRKVEPVVLTLRFNNFISSAGNRSSEDSVSIFNIKVEQMKTLIGYERNSLYLNRLFLLSDRYFVEDQSGKKAFVKQGLELAGLEKEKVVRAYNRNINLDSLYSYVFVQEEDEDAILNFSAVERVPVYKRCNENASNEQLKQCLQTKIIKHVAKNFIFNDDALKKGIQGKIYVYFVIETDGRVDEISIPRSTHPLLDFEGIRVVSEVPRFDHAATQRGKLVRMSFTLPINAKIN